MDPMGGSNKNLEEIWNNAMSIQVASRIGTDMSFKWDIFSPKINMSPKKGPFWKDISSSNHLFL